MRLIETFGCEGEAAACVPGRQAGLAIAGIVDGNHIGLVPAVGVGGGGGMGVDGRRGVVERIGVARAGRGICERVDRPRSQRVYSIHQRYAAGAPGAAA